MIAPDKPLDELVVDHAADVGGLQPQPDPLSGSIILIGKTLNESSESGARRQRAEYVVARF